MNIKRNIFKISLIVVASIFLLAGCTKNNKEAALEFKKDYESLNGVVNSKGKEHRTVSIDKTNPFVKVTPEKLIERVENGETLFIYVGDKLCPWCRSVIEKAVEVANKNKIKEILYIPIWDDEGNEILRDKYIVNENGVLEKTIEGTDSYRKMLTLFDDVLEEYTITNGDVITSTNEKRIYAPTFIYVKNKEALRMTTAISDKQKDSREELTEEMLKDEEQQLLDFFLGTTCEVDSKC